MEFGSYFEILRHLNIKHLALLQPIYFVHACLRNYFMSPKVLEFPSVVLLHVVLTWSSEEARAPTLFPLALNPPPHAILLSPS